MIAGSLVMAVGAGLFLLFKVDIPLAMWYVTANSFYGRSLINLF
jgi:hypothetical protein